MTRETEIRRGKDALARGDAPAAESMLTAIVESNADAAEALHLRALARARQGNWGGAADDAERALKARPDGASPLEREHARVLRLAQSLEPAKAARLVEEFGYAALSAAVSVAVGDRSSGLDGFVERVSTLAGEKYAAAVPEALRQYLSAKIPGRLYRVPAMQALSPQDAWGRCDWWALHGVAAADAVHELATGTDAMTGSSEVPPPPYRHGAEPHDLAARSPLPWPFVHHALLVLAYDLADELADEHPGLRAELPAIRDSVVKPLVYLGFGVGLEAQGV